MNYNNTDIRLNISTDIKYITTTEHFTKDNSNLNYINLLIIGFNLC